MVRCFILLISVGTMRTVCSVKPIQLDQRLNSIANNDSRSLQQRHKVYDKSRHSKAAGRPICSRHTITAKHLTSTA